MVRESVKVRKYRMIEDLTSDVMFEARGRDLGELFVHAAEAMFSVICTIDRVKASNPIDVELSAESVEGLLVGWLQRLIALVDTEEMFFSKFEVLEIDGKHMKARAFGEGIRPENGLTVVKAVTYYKLKVGKEGGAWKAVVSLDV